MVANNDTIKYNKILISIVKNNLFPSFTFSVLATPHLECSSLRGGLISMLNTDRVPTLWHPTVCEAGDTASFL